MPTTSFDKDSIKASIIGKLQRYNGRTIEEASNGQIYRALASTVRDQIMQKWMISREERKTNNNKRLFYLSVEFLMGRSLYTNILNLVSLDAYKQALDELHIDVDKVLQEEPEPALGNGGLGRLAACFMDSLASLDLPAMGCSIRYEYGLFRQKIVDGQQVELPDYWLGNGNVWEMPVMEDACEVHFNGHVEMGNENGRTVFRHVGYNTVEAVPYDMPLVGYDTSTVNSLRLWNFFPGEAERVGRMAIIAYGYIHMANLCVAMTFSTNGVSQLHGDILKQETFHDFYLVMPEKFSAITNGITHRRWLMACNPQLTKLICDTIGTDWVKDPELLHDLAPYADDAAFREQFEKIKHSNKVRLSNFLKEHQGAIVDPDFIFDAQSKRLHEYKRQMLNALHILVLYNRIVNDPNFTMQPRVFIFGSKAAPGYNRAKQIIRFINGLSALIAKHPRASKMLQVVFLENYDVSSAQMLIPATEISEQISTASKEASGTGNMKYMMNGAITIGTMDGANVEISEQVGMDNIYIFGMRSDTVLDMYRERNYNPMTIFETNQELRLAMTQMIDGTVLPDAPSALQDLYHSLLIGDWGNMADPFFVLKDFGSYSMAQRRIDADYADRDKWNRMAVINTAMSGVLCSDRTIREYNDTIWHLDPLKRKG